MNFFTDRKIVVRDDEKFTVALPILIDAAEGRNDAGKENQRFMYKTSAQA